MIANPQTEQCDRLNAALLHTLTGLDRLALGRWEMAADNVNISFITFDQGDGYLCVEGNADLPGPLTAWEWLAQTVNLPAGTKLVRDAGKRWVVRVEALLGGEESDLAAHVNRVWTRVRVARQMVGGAGIKEVAGAPPPAPDLARLCTEAKWPFTQRAEGRLAVPLESGPVPATAVVAVDATHMIRVVVDVLECDSLSEVSRQAMGQLLLRLCHLVRLVRAGIVEQKNQITVRLEVALDAWASAAELGHAFGVLSVACGLCGRELEALQEEAVACEFLAGEEATANVPGKSNRQSADTAGKEES